MKCGSIKGNAQTRGYAKTNVTNHKVLKRNMRLCIAALRAYTFARMCTFKGNQKGKVTCYTLERVNKNELFGTVITFLKSVVY